MKRTNYEAPLRPNVDHIHAGLYEYAFRRTAARSHLAQYQILDNLTCSRSECETTARSAMRRPRRHVTSPLQLSRGSIQSDLTQADMHQSTHFFPVAG